MSTTAPIEVEAKAEASKLGVYEVIVRGQATMPFNDIMTMATAMHKSKFFPSYIDTPEKALAVMMTARDLGIPFTFGLQAISIINGRPCLEAKLLLALVFRTRELETFKIDNTKDGIVVVTGNRKGKDPYTATWTRKRADDLGVTTGYNAKTSQKYVKDNWQKQPQNMLTWRAIAEFCRFTFPDAISGCYIAEEIAEDVVLEPAPLGQEGKVTEVQNRALPAAPAKAPGEQTRHENKSSDDIPDEELGKWTIPGGPFKGLSLMEAAIQQTPTGRLKGAEYLDEMATRASDPNARDIISRYMAIQRHEGYLPAKGYDAKDIPVKGEKKKTAKAEPDAAEATPEAKKEDTENGSDGSSET